MIPRYSREEMSGIFSERAKFARWLEIEILAVEARVGSRRSRSTTSPRSSEKARLRRRANRRTSSRVRHHDVVAFVENVRENVGESRAAMFTTA